MDNGDQETRPHRRDDPEATLVRPPRHAAEPRPVLRPPAHFYLDGVLGRGSYGEVYRARHRHLGRPAAIKLNADPAADRRHRFRCEARITARLEHPNIIPLYDADEDFMAMRLVSGRSLAERLAGTPASAADLPTMIEVLIQTAGAIAYAHHEGVIHRDIKAQNVVVGDHGEVQVIDWGLAVELVDGRLPDRGKVPGIAGTPACLAPEVAHDRRREIGPAADVFCLGALLYHVLAGRPPYLAAAAHASLERARRERWEPLSDDAPPALKELQQRCMASDPGERGSAVAFREGLRLWLWRSANEPAAHAARDEARELIAHARACDKRAWEQAYRYFSSSLAAFERAGNLAPDLAGLAAEGERARRDFLRAALQAGDIVLARLIKQGFRPPSVTSDRVESTHQVPAVP